jgi:hypothetical protein
VLYCKTISLVNCLLDVGSARLDVLHDDSTGLGVNTPLADDGAGAADELGGGAVGLQAGKAAPLTEDLAVGDHDAGDLVLLAESLDELLVGVLVAGSGEDAEVGSATVKGLHSLLEATGKTLVEEGVADDLLEGILGGDGDDLRDRDGDLGGNGVLAMGKCSGGGSGEGTVRDMSRWRSRGTRAGLKQGAL